MAGCLLIATPPVTGLTGCVRRWAVPMSLTVGHGRLRIAHTLPWPTYTGVNDMTDDEKKERDERRRKQTLRRTQEWHEKKRLTLSRAWGRFHPMELTRKDNDDETK